MEREINGRLVQRKAVSYYGGWRSARRLTTVDEQNKAFDHCNDERRPSADTARVPDSKRSNGPANYSRGPGRALLRERLRTSWSG